MKEPGTAHWALPNDDAINSSGFLGLPSGLGVINDVYGSLVNSSYGGLAENAFFWSSSKGDSGKPFYLGLYFKPASVKLRQSNSNKGNYSVRCLRN